MAHRPVSLPSRMNDPVRLAAGNVIRNMPRQVQLACQTKQHRRFVELQADCGQPGALKRPIQLPRLRQCRQSGSAKAIGEPLRNAPTDTITLADGQVSESDTWLSHTAHATAGNLQCGRVNRDIGRGTSSGRKVSSPLDVIAAIAAIHGGSRHRNENR